MLDFRLQEIFVDAQKYSLNLIGIYVKSNYSVV